MRTIDLRDGAWHHIAVAMTVADATTALEQADFRYIDGQEVGPASTGLNPSVCIPEHSGGKRARG